MQNQFVLRYPSETKVKRGTQVVHGEKELVEKLGCNDLCPCGSGRRFQALLPAHRQIRRIHRDYFFPRVAKRLAYRAKSKSFGPCISFRLTRLPGKWIISGCAVTRLQSATSAKGASDFPRGILSEANFAGRFAT
jgi:hypothetical protein